MASTERMSDVADGPPRCVCLVSLGWEPELAIAALETLAEVWSFPATRLAIAEGDPARLSQMAYAHEVSAFLGRAPMGALPFDASIIETPYAIRIHRGSNLSECEQQELVGLVWDAHPDPRVDLKRPRTQLHAYVVDEGVLWGRGLGTDRFVPTDTQRRPFVTSSQLPPRRARGLLDLAEVRSGDAVLDPFCGTGTVLIEAVRLGAFASGSDIDGRAVKGAFANASFEEVHIDLRLHDAMEPGGWRSTFDAIVTDLPYGRAASLHGASRSTLAARWLAHAEAMLRPNGRIVAMAPMGVLPEGAPPLVELHRILEPVHAGLTREIVVYQRPT